MSQASPVDIGVGDSGGGQDALLRQWLVALAARFSLTYLLAHAEDGVIWGCFTHGTLITADEQIGARPDLRPWRLPRFRLDRLQQCRAFGENAELLLWKGADAHAWSARMAHERGEQVAVHTLHLSGAPGDWPDASTIADAEAVEGAISLERLCEDEEQILWGTRAEQITKDFTLLADGAQGLRHAVPLRMAQEDFTAPAPRSLRADARRLYRPVRLVVRHYLAYDRGDRRAGEGGVAPLATGAARIALSRLVTVRAVPAATAGQGRGKQAEQHAATGEE